MMTGEQFEQLKIVGRAGGVAKIAVEEIERLREELKVLKDANVAVKQEAKPAKVYPRSEVFGKRRRK